MAILKRKTNGSWETVAQANDFPVPVPVQITEIQANLTQLNVTENGSYEPEAPHNGFSRVDVDVPTADETEYTTSIRASKTASITFTSLRGNPREWWIEPSASFEGDTSNVYYVVGGVKTSGGAEMYICNDAMLTFGFRMQSSAPTYSNGSLTVPSGNSRYYYRSGITYILHYKL